MTRRGRFIAFEGIDGCGKTSQVEAVAELLRKDLNQEVVIAQAIGKEGLSGKLRELLLHATDLAIDPKQAVALFAAARLDALKQINVHQLAGRHVFCDRWILSSNIYQGDPKVAGSMSVGNIEELHMCFGIREPDAYVVYRIEPEEAFERLKARGMGDRFENGLESLTHYAARYSDAVRKTRHFMLSPRMLDVDAHGTKEEVAERTWHQLRPMFV